jgi:hypothetical protein
MSTDKTPELKAPTDMVARHLFAPYPIACKGIPLSEPQPARPRGPSLLKKLAKTAKKKQIVSKTIEHTSLWKLLFWILLLPLTCLLGWHSYQHQFKDSKSDVLLVTSSNVEEASKRIEQTLVEGKAVFLELSDGMMREAQHPALVKIAPSYKDKVLFVELAGKQAPKLFLEGIKLAGEMAYPMHFIKTAENGFSSTGLKSDKELRQFVDESLNTGTSPVLHFNASSAKSVQATLKKQTDLPVLLVGISPDARKVGITEESTEEDVILSIADKYKGKLTVIEFDPYDPACAPFIQLLARSIPVQAQPEFLFTAANGPVAYAIGLKDEAKLDELITSSFAKINEPEQPATATPQATPPGPWRPQASVTPEPSANN